MPYDFLIYGGAVVKVQGTVYYLNNFAFSGSADPPLDIDAYPCVKYVTGTALMVYCSPSPVPAGRNRYGGGWFEEVLAGVQASGAYAQFSPPSYEKAALFYGSCYTPSSTSAVVFQSYSTTPPYLNHVYSTSPDWYYSVDHVYSERYKVAYVGIWPGGTQLCNHGTTRVAAYFVPVNTSQLTVYDAVVYLAPYRYATAALPGTSRRVKLAFVDISAVDLTPP